jgi:hypothetical protein
MSVATALSQLRNRIGAALSHCNNALAMKGAEYANSIWEVGDRINALPTQDNSALIGLIDGTASNIIIPDGTKIIKEYKFYKMTEFISISIPNSVTMIQDYAFAYTNIKTIELSVNLKSIGSGAFVSTDFESIKIPPGVTKISGLLFQMARLQHADIPNGVETIQYGAFAQCNNLTSLILRRTSSITTLENTYAFDSTGISAQNGYIYVPQSMLTSYQNATNWSVYASQFRALEEYTIDGTINGELDNSKI